MRARKIIDLTDQRFGRLVALSRASATHWLCRCDCGKQKEVREFGLRFQGTASCGCLRQETAAATGRRTATKHGHKAGGEETPEYRAWRSLTYRCHNKNAPNYHRYGGRGITVDPRWLGNRGFEHFIEDMGPRPPTPPGWKRYYSIERKKNHLGYSKENCIWATRKAQANNRRGNRLLTLHGKTQTLAQWADEYGMTANCLGLRLLNGDSLEAALSKPVMVRSPRGRHT